MNVDIRIMASHRREENVCKILSKLDMNDSIVVWDDRPNGGDAMYAARKTRLTELPEGVTHRLVLQDDVDICDNFISHVERIAERNPNYVVSLINSLNPRNYPNTRGTPYYEVKTVSGCAIMMPIDLIKPCFHWSDTYEHPKLKKHDDLMISRYCNLHDIKLVTILPCIVQHLGKESLLSRKYSWERVCKNYDLNPITVDCNIHSIQKVR